MKILFVSAILPYPLYSGGQIRMYNLLKILSEKHDITLMTFTRSDKEKANLAELPFLKKIVTIHRGRAWQPSYMTKSMFGPYPLLLESYHNSEMLASITDELAHGGYDGIHLEPGYVWPSVPKSSVPVVVSEHNIEHVIYDDFVHQFPFAPLKPFLSLDVAKIKFWEKRIWREATIITAVSEDDKKEIELVSGRRDVAVVPNGVDVASFPFKMKKTDPKAPVFLFVGNFSWIQNRDAAAYLILDIWPRVLEAYPKGALRIVGRGATKDIKKIVQAPGVELFEHVNEITEEFAKADALLAPIRIGGGTKFKILEAMACGCPVVTTPQGAMGLDVLSGKEVVIAHSPEAFLTGIDAVIKDAQKRKNILQNARKKIESEYAWGRIADSLQSVWHEAYGKH